MNKLIIFCLTLIFLSCKTDNENELFFDKNDLGKIIKSFVQNKPLSIPPYIESKKEWSHPSYHVYFYEQEKDTLMEIFQAPFLLEFLKKEWETENESEYSSVEPDGMLFYKQKNPIIFFGLEYYINRKYMTNLIIKKIPDSLKFNGSNYHLKKELRKRMKYKIENKEFIIIN